MGNTNTLLRDLALEAKRLKQETGTKDKEEKEREARKKDGYVLTLAEYPDVIITKETSRMTVIPHASPVPTKSSGVSAACEV